MTDTTKTPDPRPTKCRFRLKDEGKLYPESTCDYCRKGLSTKLGNSCAIMRPAPAVTVKPLDLHDAVTHRHSWTTILEAAIENAEHEDDKSYIEHEKRALLNLLDTLSAIQPEAPGAREAALREALQDAANTLEEVAELCWDKCAGSALKPVCDDASDIAGAGFEKANAALIDQPAPASTSDQHSSCPNTWDQPAPAPTPPTVQEAARVLLDARPNIPENTMISKWLRALSDTPSNPLTD